MLGDGSHVRRQLSIGSAVAMFLLVAATLRAQSTWVQSGFHAEDPPVGFYDTLAKKQLRAEALSLNFRGSAVIALNLNTAIGLQEIRDISTAIGAAVASTQRPFLGYFSFPRMPGFFWPSELDLQSDSYRSQSLKSNGELWERRPRLPTEAHSRVAFTGQHLDITNPEAVGELLSNIRVLLDQNGPASTSVGPLYGFIYLNEWKLTGSYASVFSGGPSEHDVVHPTISPPDVPIRMGGGTRHVELFIDDDPVYSFRVPPKRAVPLYSSAARDSFVGFASALGYSYTKLPADRNEFNNDDSTLEPLPAWVQFVSVSDTTYWGVWESWLYDTWTSFLLRVAASMNGAQRGNPNYRGVIWFGIPYWYSMPASASTAVTYSYLDSNDVLQTATETLTSYAEYETLDSAQSGNDMDRLLASPEIAGMVHETTNGSLHFSESNFVGMTSEEIEFFVENHHRHRYHFLAEGTLAKREAGIHGKTFGAFARSQFFDATAPTAPIPANYFQRAFDRTLDLLSPFVVATLPNTWFIDPAFLPPDYLPVMQGATGELEAVWFSELVDLSTTLPLGFSEHPWNQFPAAGGAGAFHVTVQGGTGSYTYQWEESETGAGNWSAVASGPDVTGESTSDLVFTSPGADRAKWYRCTVNDGANSISSSLAELFGEEVFSDGFESGDTSMWTVESD